MVTEWELQEVLDSIEWQQEDREVIDPQLHPRNEHKLRFDWRQATREAMKRETKLQKRK